MTKRVKCNIGLEKKNQARTHRVRDKTNVTMKANLGKCGIWRKKMCYGVKNEKKKNPRCHLLTASPSLKLFLTALSLHPKALDLFYF